MRFLSSKIASLALALMLLSPGAWAQSRIDQLSASAAVSGTDTVPICQGCGAGTNMLGVTAAQLLTYIQAAVKTLTNTTFNCGSTGNVCTVRIGTDVSGLAANIATFLGTSSSANLAAAVTDETGTGALAFADGATHGGTTKFTGSVDLTNQAIVVEIANEGVTGTTVNKLAKLTGAPSTAIIAATADTNGEVGIVIAGAGTTSNALVAIQGRASCIFDAATTAGNYVQISPTVAGDCHDAGAILPTSGQIIGRVLSTNGAGGTYPVQLAGGGGGGGASVSGAGVAAGQSSLGMGDNNTALAAAHFDYFTNAAFTAPRTKSLPNSATQGAGLIIIRDSQRTVTSTNTATFCAQGTDQIDGGGAASCTPAIGTAGFALVLQNDGAGNWTTVAANTIGTQSSPANQVFNSLGSNGVFGTVQLASTNLSDSSALSRLSTADQTVTGGANVTSQSQSTGNLTIDCGSRPLQYITNGGAWTLTAPANDGSCLLLVTNNGSAGTITFSGFTVGASTGDALTTTNTNKFTIDVWRINGVSGYRVAAHQ